MLIWQSIPSLCWTERCRLILLAWAGKIITWLSMKVDELSSTSSNYCFLQKAHFVFIWCHLSKYKFMGLVFFRIECGEMRRHQLTSSFKANIHRDRRMQATWSCTNVATNVRVLEAIDGERICRHCVFERVRLDLELVCAPLKSGIRSIGHVADEHYVNAQKFVDFVRKILVAKVDRHLM